MVNNYTIQMLVNMRIACVTGVFISGIILLAIGVILFVTADEEGFETLRYYCRLLVGGSTFGLLIFTLGFIFLP